MNIVEAASCPTRQRKTGGAALSVVTSAMRAHGWASRLWEPDRRGRFGRVVMRLAMGLPLVVSCSGCNQSAVTMWLGAGLTGGKLALFSRSSTTSWTTDSEYLCGANFFLHSKKITLQTFAGWSLLNSFRNSRISVLVL